ncbi:DUF805 domain-containing protein [Apilactobacillus apisilvae]|uniref:DUF805 domain-containing protein n=1 Tax=Apilactobacillus apisilvae TaxID=2923364 RepID=A0ABY4PGU2_9LACO|nr:DUF805 domain-containing protein [Apilactobacillus apisilvae]UQS84878.1 DUF805 domain-containing protein [Apilactobacillus apisilvae]
MRHSYASFIKNTFNYKGRTNLKDFLFTYLLNVGILILTVLLVMVSHGNRIILIPVWIFLIYLVIVILPTLSLMVRRYRDAGINGYYFLLIFSLLVIISVFADHLSILSFLRKVLALINFAILLSPTKKS